MSFQFHLWVNFEFAALIVAWFHDNFHQFLGFAESDNGHYVYVIADGCAGLLLAYVAARVSRARMRSRPLPEPLSDPSEDFIQSPVEEVRGLTCDSRIHF